MKSKKKELLEIVEKACDENKTFLFAILDDNRDVSTTVNGVSRDLFATACGVLTAICNEMKIDMDTLVEILKMAEKVKGGQK